MPIPSSRWSIASGGRDTEPDPVFLLAYLSNAPAWLADCHLLSHPLGLDL